MWELYGALFVGVIWRLRAGLGGVGGGGGSVVAVDGSLFGSLSRTISQSFSLGSIFATIVFMSSKLCRICTLMMS